MVKYEQFKKRIEEIKKILELENDNIMIKLMPNEYYNKKPFCDYKAVYQSEHNAIFINPNSFKEYSLSEMTAIVAHELFHSYQNKNNPSIFETQINTNYESVGLEYVKQPLEMEAYAFQTAIYMMYEECSAKFELDGIDIETSNKINELAEEYYQKYKDKFVEIVYNDCFSKNN